VTELL